jgi:Holliday junction resolvasome RuvABC ATP-dependent DNA helicase subunit
MSLATLKKHFATVIGQDRTKERVLNQLQSMENGNPGKSIFITGRTGLGKDKMTGCIASAINKELGFELHEFICPSMITGKPYAKLAESLDSGTPCVVHISEAHRLKMPRVELTRLRQFIMAWTDKQNIGKEISINDGELRATVNWKNAIFVLNTNFPAKLEEGAKSTSFADRFLFDTLEDYTPAQIERILAAMVASEGLSIHAETQGLITHCARGTARPLANICDELKAIASAKGGKSTLNKADVLKAIKLANLFPRGLTVAELKMLQYCSTPKRDTALSSLLPNLESADMRKSIAFLQTCYRTKKGEVLGFLERSTGGLKTSSIGLRYMKEIESEGFALPA